MRQLLILIVLLSASVLLLGCTLGESAVYNHLQEQNPGEVHKTGDDFLPEIDGEDDEQVDGSHTSSEAHCAGEFTLQEIAYRDLELRAVTEDDPAFCLDLPNDPLVIDCPDQPLALYYSKERCLDYFKE